MKIRTYQPTDEQAYLNSVALAYMHSQFRDQISDQRDSFGEADGYRTVISLVATMDGLVVGAIDAGAFNDDRVKHDLYVQHQGRGSYIEVFAVSPSVQGQGLGRALLKACLIKLKTAGADFVEIFTRSDAAANGLYQSLGAREIAHNWRALATPKSYQAPKAKWALDEGHPGAGPHGSGRAHRSLAAVPAVGHLFHRGGHGRLHHRRIVSRTHLLAEVVNRKKEP